MQADPGRAAGILAIAGQEFYRNGHKIVMPRSAFEKEMHRDIRNELILLQSNGIGEVYPAGGELYLDINQEEISTAIFEAEKLNRTYDGDLSELVENESPTQVDLEENSLEPEFDNFEEVEGKAEFQYSDCPGLIATLGCFGQGKEDVSEYEVVGYLEEDATPHLDLLKQTGHLKTEEGSETTFYSLTENRYERDAERIHRFLEEEYNLNIPEFREDFNEVKELLDPQLETMDLTVI